MSRELKLWEGDFGDEYTDRNELTEENLKNRVDFWSTVFKTEISQTPTGPTKILEVGANVGINLAAISQIMHRPYQLYALEPNEKARTKLKQNVKATIVHGEAASIQASPAEFDFVFTSGVMIHMNDEYLSKAMDEIYRVSAKWILCAEYFSAEPLSKSYRGVDDFIYLRDYGSLWLNKYRMACLSYGFSWKRLSGIDNLTWWMFEKAN